MELIITYLIIQNLYCLLWKNTANKAVAYNQIGIPRFLYYRYLKGVHRQCRVGLGTEKGYFVTRIQSALNVIL